MELETESEHTTYSFRLTLGGAELDELVDWFKSLPPVHLNPNHQVAYHLYNRLEDVV